MGNTSPPGERERDSSPPEQGKVDPPQDGDRPPAHHLSAAKKHSRPSATAAANKEADIRALQQLRATSEDHKVHSEENPRGAEDLATSRAATTNPQKTR